MENEKKVDLSRATRVDTDVYDTVKDLFEYHPWDELQREAGRNIREALKGAYLSIIDNVPPCPTRTRALNMLVDCRMLANAAITHRGKY